MNLHDVRTILKKNVGLVYRRAKPIPIQCNSERCLVLRQQFAKTFIDLLHSKWTIIDLDESWINETNYTRMIWCSPKSPGTYSSKAVNPMLKLIANSSSKENVYFSLMQKSTNCYVMMLFQRNLQRQLDAERPDWRETTYFLLDGARFHTSEAMRVHFRKMDLKVIFTGPYSFSSAPIELLFAALKHGKINTEKASTGKKQVFSFLLLISQIFRLGCRHGGQLAVQSQQELLCKILAPHSSLAFQIPLLRKDLMNRVFIIQSGYIFHNTGGHVQIFKIIQTEINIKRQEKECLRNQQKNNYNY